MNTSDHSEKTDVSFDARAMLRTITSYVTIEPAAEISRYATCGARAMEHLPGIGALDGDERARLSWRCYDAPAGARVKLVIAFVRNGRPEKPTGLLELMTTRGKLSPLRLDLQGDRDRIEIDYHAPDETIKVSIRARLKGYQRAKIHLHLI